MFHHYRMSNPFIYFNIDICYICDGRGYVIIDGNSYRCSFCNGTGLKNQKK